MVARSASVMGDRPSPKNSTNLPTTLFLRQHLGHRQHRSVAVTPSLSLPVRRKPMTSGKSMENRLAEHRSLGLDAAHAPSRARQGR